jgi:hypothetical protein
MSNTTLAAPPAPTEQRLARPSAAFGTRGIIISQYDELVRFAETVSNSGLAPKGMEKPQAVFVAVQMGLEVGLTPMAALQNVAVVNGRPTLWGDAQLAVCRGTGELETFEEWFEVGGVKTTRNPAEYKDDTAAVCKVKRAGGQEVESAFSVADAKRAGLWGKAGPWTQYPFRMLRNRARSFALRDTFGDALKGFRSAEEVKDEEPERDVTPPNAAASALFNQPASLPEPVAKPAVNMGKAPATVVERARARGAGKPAIREEMAKAAASVVEGASPAEETRVESARDAAPADLLDVPAKSLPELVAARCEADGVTWPEVAEALHANGLTDPVYDSPTAASDEELAEALRMWSQVVAAVKAMRKGGEA